MVNLFFKKREMKINYRGKEVIFKGKEIPFWYEGIGLMFKRGKRATALIFNFKKSVNMAIHSWFVFFPFVAIWLDENNKLIEIKLVKPFKIKILPSRKYKTLIEVPVNSKYDEVIRLLVGEKETFK